MRELVLVLPELATLPGADARATEAGGTAARLGVGRFPAVQRLDGGWRSWLARSLHLDALAACDAASVVAASLAAEPRGAWIATPLQLAAGMQTVHVPADGILELGPGEALEWSQEFARVFGGDRLRLEPLPAGGLLLLGLDAPGARTVEPAALLGRSLDAALPDGAGGARLRALMAEIEMWLHEHPINAVRMRRGEAPVGSFWLWGGGGPAWEAGGGSGVRAALRDHLYADDPWVAAVARLRGLPASPPPAAFAGCRGQPGRAVLVVSPGRLRAPGAPAAGGLLEIVDRAYLQPALQALHAGELGLLTLVAGERAVCLRGSDRFRLWRPAREWPRALAG